MSVVMNPNLWVGILGAQVALLAVACAGLTRRALRAERDQDDLRRNLASTLEQNQRMFRRITQVVVCAGSRVRIAQVDPDLYTLTTLTETSSGHQYLVANRAAKDPS